MTATPKTFWQSVFVGINSVLNTSFDEVIGNKDDGHTGNSIYSLVKTLNEDAHAVSSCYPLLADPVVVTAGGGAWTLGAFVEIVPINTITDDFDIHWVTIASPNANEDYELRLYYGATDILCACIPFTRSNNFVNSIQVGTKTPLIPANSRIRAKIADGTGGAVAGIKITYHEY